MTLIIQSEILGGPQKFVSIAQDMFMKGDIGMATYEKQVELEH